MATFPRVLRPRRKKQQQDVSVDIAAHHQSTVDLGGACALNNDDVDYDDAATVRQQEFAVVDFTLPDELLTAAERRTRTSTRHTVDIERRKDEALAEQQASFEVAMECQRSELQLQAHVAEQSAERERFTAEMMRRELELAEREIALLRREQAADARDQIQVTEQSKIGPSDRISQPVYNAAQRSTGPPSATEMRAVPVAQRLSNAHSATSALATGAPTGPSSSHSACDPNAGAAASVSTFDVQQRMHNSTNPFASTQQAMPSASGIGQMLAATHISASNRRMVPAAQTTRSNYTPIFASRLQVAEGRGPFGVATHGAAHQNPYAWQPPAPANRSWAQVNALTPALERYQAPNADPNLPHFHQNEAHPNHPQAPWYGACPQFPQIGADPRFHQNDAAWHARPLEHRRLHELPSFTGRPEEWPAFSIAFQTTTTAYGYSDLENLLRLQRCLSGEARRAVEHVLIYPHHVNMVMGTLQDAFGQPQQLVRSQIARVRALPYVDESHTELLGPMAIAVRNLVTFLDSPATQHYLYDTTILEGLIERLPSERRLDWALATRHLELPNLEDFSMWLSDIARLIQRIAPTTTQTTTRSTRPKTAAARGPVLLNAQQAEKTSCAACKKGHDVTGCQSFLSKTVNDRWTLVLKHRLCFGCLKADHMLPGCPSKRRCPEEGCHLWHNALLHGTRADDHTTTLQRPPNNAVAASVTAADEEPVLHRVLPVTLRNGTKTVSTYAVLDDCSSLTLVDAAIADQLSLDGAQHDLPMKWLKQHQIVEDSKRVTLQISGANDDDRRFTIRAYTVVDLDPLTQSVDVSAMQATNEHLKGIPLADYRDVTPKILIGLDNHTLGVPLNTKTSPDIDADNIGLVATQTRLGWVVYGSRGNDPTSPTTHSVLHIHCDADIRQRDEELSQLVRGFFGSEDFGVKKPDAPVESDDIIRARSIMAATTRRVGERFETGLLWKADDVRLPDSYGMALRRLRSLESKMRRDDNLAKQYAEQIADYVAKGYARKLTREEAAIRSSRTWYLPHFAAKNPNKPEKFRMVFDAAATVEGVCLNAMLLPGPDDNVPLTRLLMQFRLGLVGICADIREMFHQVLIRRDDQDAQRFLWRDKNSTGRPDEYVMQAMTFGSTCSPASAQHIKNTNAAQCEAEFPAAAAAVRHKHYVDDFVACFATPEEAIETTLGVIEIHRRAGFELRGFVTNNSAVLAAIGGGSATEETVRLEPELAPVKILGMGWNTATDSFVFRTTFSRVHESVMSGERRPTKRELLSASMSIFDPFGVLAEFMLPIKVILQDLWRMNVGWDELVPEAINDRWQEWRTQIARTRECSVPRCYAPNINNGARIQLHIFADASEVAYAAVAYFRIEVENSFRIVFVCGKSRCAPLKLISVPRLELQAAVLATRLLQEIRSTHEHLEIEKTVMWSDSATVVSWIRSDQRRYKPYVAFRVAEIVETAPSHCWRWLPTSMNAADDGTRLRRPHTFDPESRWIRGPEWLRHEPSWPANAAEPADTRCAEEERSRGPAHRTEFVGVTVLDRPTLIFDRFSRFLRICRTTAWVKRFAHNASTKRDDRRQGELSTTEVEAAAVCLCRVAQREGFPSEYAALSNGQPIDKSSGIFELWPYLDDAGVMRVNGRTEAADESHLPGDAKRPILLPSKHRLSMLIVRHFHERMAHQLTNATIAAVRQKYWVPSLRKLVKTVQSNCNTCRIRKAQPRIPAQGQLPRDRITPFVRPFTSTGLDYFGPVAVTVNRRREKRWVALFTCMATRAVHLEVAKDLSTDACLICIRNLSHVRGVPALIRCDNGTNFIGARNELQRQDGFFDGDAIKRELTRDGVEWRFNCPGNPEAGGAWERLIQSVKRILMLTLKEEAPHVETLRALLLEAANLVNSRPLTHVPVDPKEPDPITPNHFLIGGPNTATSPRPMEPESTCVRDQWRVCRELSRRFWKQWVADYLPELTRRSKHYPDQKPLQVDDLVVICDPNQPRSRWPRGRVIGLTPGADGRVRTAEVLTSGGTLRRPLTKLAVLELSPPPMNSADGGGDVEFAER